MGGFYYSKFNVIHHVKEKSHGYFHRYRKSTWETTVSICDVGKKGTLTKPLIERAY